MSLVHDAARNNNVATLRALLGCVDANGADPKGRTALSWAASMGNLECVKVLLEANANLDEADLEKWTPMHHAVKHGHNACVKARV